MHRLWPNFYYQWLSTPLKIFLFYLKASICNGSLFAAICVPQQFMFVIFISILLFSQGRNSNCEAVLENKYVADYLTCIWYNLATDKFCHLRNRLIDFQGSCLNCKTHLIVWQCSVFTGVNYYDTKGIIYKKDQLF